MRSVVGYRSAEHSRDFRVMNGRVLQSHRTQISDLEARQTLSMGLNDQTKGSIDQRVPRFCHRSEHTDEARQAYQNESSMSSNHRMSQLESVRCVAIHSRS